MGNRKRKQNVAAATLLHNWCHMNSCPMHFMPHMDHFTRTDDWHWRQFTWQCSVGWTKWQLAASQSLSHSLTHLQRAGTYIWKRSHILHTQTFTQNIASSEVFEQKRHLFPTQLCVVCNKVVIVIVWLHISKHFSIWNNVQHSAASRSVLSVGNLVWD